MARGPGRGGGQPGPVGTGLLREQARLLGAVVEHRLDDAEQCDSLMSVLRLCAGVTSASDGPLEGF